MCTVCADNTLYIQKGLPFFKYNNQIDQLISRKTDSTKQRF